MDIEKTVPDETEEKIWEFLELISEDVDTFIFSQNYPDDARSISLQRITLNTTIYTCETLVKHLRRFMFKGGLLGYQYLF